MTAEKKEYAEALGLLSGTDETPEEMQDKKMALQYVMRGASIPQVLLRRLEKYRRANTVRARRSMLVDWKETGLCSA